MLVQAGLGWVWGLPVSRARAASRTGGGREARLFPGFRSGRPSAGTSKQPGETGDTEGVAAAPGRLPRPGSHLVSGASAGRALRAAQTRERTRTRTRIRTRSGRRRPGGGRRLSAPYGPAPLGSRPRAVGEGDWVVAEEEEGSGGGDQPAPARPSPARCPGRTRRPGRRWRTSRRRSRTCRPWWDTRTGSPSPPRWLLPPPAPREGEEEAEARPPPPRNS